MLRLKCSCGKPLAAGETQCSLCAAGFAPARQVDMAVSYQTTGSVNTREYSGIDCPRCHSKLSVAEVAVSSCTHCHAVLAHDIIPTVRQENVPSFTPRRSDETAETIKLWPEKAPTI